MSGTSKANPFSTTLKILRICKLYQGDGESATSFYLQCFILRTIGTFVSIVGPLIDYIQVSKANVQNIDSSKNVSLILFGITAFLTFNTFTYQYKRWKRLLDDMVDFEQYGKPKEAQKVIDRGNYLAKFILLVAFLGCVVRGINARRDATVCHGINRETGLNRICDVYLPIWLPFENPPKNFLLGIIVAQFILLYMACSALAAAFFLVWEATEVYVTHLSHLKIWFVRITKETDYGKRNKEMRLWIQYHNHLYRIAIKFNRLVKLTLGQTAFTAGVNFATCENILFNIKAMEGAVLFVAWMACMTSLCYSGQRILTETASVADAIYETNWYTLDARLKKAVQFIIMRAQNPEYLEALPLGQFNYALLVLVMRASYSYLAVLQNLT